MTLPTAAVQRPGRWWSPIDPQARAWVVCCLAWAVLSLCFQALPGHAWEWRLELAWREPWRWWSAAWVHFGAAHLAMNLAGCLVVAALGRAAQLGGLWVVAWLLVWPLSHVGLVLHEAGMAYRGLSGVLHGGVAVASVAMMSQQDRRVRRWGMAVSVGLALKVLWELPWRAELAMGPGGGFVVAAWAHASGALAGWVVASGVLGLHLRWRLREPA